ncbi:MAG: YdcF family protein [Bacteroidota bacterium]
MIVLGGYTSYDKGRKRMGFNEAAERFVFPLQMLSTGKTQRLILTGGSGNVFNRDYFESSAAKKFALDFGIADSQILIDDKSRNTWENAVETKKILDSLKVNEPVLLVTSAGHMRRSMGCFKKVGVAFIPYSVNYQSHLDRKYSWDAILIPSAGTISKWDALIHEWVGYLAYKLTGKA